MGLVVLKNGDGTLRRAWYATITTAGRRTTMRLSTPLCGRIPLDEAGKFSLGLVGDAAFERSKQAARAELDRFLAQSREAKTVERESPGELERRIVAKVTGRRFKVPAVADLAEENGRRAKYAVENERGASHPKTVRMVLRTFAAWCEENAPKAKNILDVDEATVRRYLDHLATRMCRATLRKHETVLGEAFSRFLPPGATNPFRVVHKDDGARGEADARPHSVPSDELVERLFEIAGRDGLHPWLRRLAVLAASTGLRIGDCCLFEWSSIDLRRGVIETTPRKTIHCGKPPKVTIPLFSADPKASDFHPVFGRLRAEIEGALANGEGAGGGYFIPEAARTYLRDSDRIVKLGKKLFARAIAEENGGAVEDVKLVGDEVQGLNPAQVLERISSSGWADAKRARVATVYELFALEKKSYARISEATGLPKGRISQDLAEVERLVGQRVRTGETQAAAKANGIRKLILATREERHGRRSACVYGWHSLRGFTATRLFRDGATVEQIAAITGHRVADTLLTHYLRERSAIEAKNVKAAICSRAVPQNAIEAPRTPAHALPAPRAEDGAVARLERLEGLFRSGLIDADERARERARILSEI